MSDENRKSYMIPQNYEDNLITASGISIRNIIEGVILFAIIGGVIWFIPIESVKIKAILIILLGGSAGVFGVMGIHHYSLSEYAMLVMRFKSSNRELKRDTIFDDNIEESLDSKEELNSDNDKIINEERGKSHEKSRKRKQKK